MTTALAMLPLQRAQWVRSSGVAQAASAAAAVPPILVEESGSELENSDVEMEKEPIHFMEVFSPPRVCFAVRRFGLTATPLFSLDLTTGSDFMTMEDRAHCLRMIELQKPAFLMISPPCTMYSPLQQLFNLRKMSEQQKARRFLEADALLDFGMVLCKKQHQGHRLYCFEHPQKASSWGRHTVQEVRELPGSQSVSFDQCRTGLVTPGENPQPIRKRTTLMTNAQGIIEVFQGLQCQCHPGTHRAIEGSIDGIPLSKWCQHYTPSLCEKLAEGVAASLPLPPQQEPSVHALPIAD